MNGLSTEDVEETAINLNRKTCVGKNAKGQNAVGHKGSLYADINFVAAEVSASKKLVLADCCWPY